MLSCLMLSFVEMPQASHGVIPGESQEGRFFTCLFYFLQYAGRVSIALCICCLILLIVVYLYHNIRPP